MLYKCNVLCYTQDQDQLEKLNIEVNDEGMYLPFAIKLDVVIAAKVTSLDEDDISFGCTTITTIDGDKYLIDTKYNTFLKDWEKYLNQ